MKEVKKEVGVPLFSESKEYRRANSIKNELSRLLDSELVVRGLDKEQAAEYLKESVITLQNAMDNFQTAAKKATTEEEFELAEANLLAAVTVELYQIIKSVRPSKIASLFSGISSPSASTLVREKIIGFINSQFFDIADEKARTEMNKNPVEAYEMISKYAKTQAGKRREQVRPTKGNLIYTVYIRQSELGDIRKDEIREGHFYTGKVEPQIRAGPSALDYVAATLKAGIFYSMKMASPFPTATTTLVYDWNVASWGKTAAEGAEAAKIMPSPTSMLGEIEEKYRKSDKSLVVLFKRPINAEHVKEVQEVESGKKPLRSAQWNEVYEDYYNDSITGDVETLLDPYVKVYVVVPATNPKINRPEKNQWKVAFYDLENAKTFAAQAKLHPNWYDNNKGWRIELHYEQKRDLAIHLIENVLRTYLTPGVIMDLDPYLEDPENFREMPIYEELQMLHDLRTELIRDRKEVENEDDIAKLEKSLSEGLQRIQDRLTEKNIPFSGYGLANALESLKDFLQENLIEEKAPTIARTRS